MAENRTLGLSGEEIAHNFLIGFTAGPVRVFRRSRNHNMPTGAGSAERD